MKACRGHPEGAVVVRPTAGWPRGMLERENRILTRRNTSDFLKIHATTLNSLLHVACYAA